MNGTEAMERICALLERTNKLLGEGGRDGQCDCLHKMITGWSVEPEIIRVDDDIVEYLEEIFKRELFTKRVCAEVDARHYKRLEDEIAKDKENK